MRSSTHIYVTVLLFFVAVVPAPILSPDDAAHDLAVKELADIAALYQVIINYCPDMLIDASKLTTIGDRQRFVRSKDASVLVREGRLAVAAFEKEVQAAPSAQAWCDANLELYGPAGRSIPGVMIKRSN